MSAGRTDLRHYAVAILLICSVFVAFAESYVEKNCAGFNQYCLNHWDCCSNSCMSYLHRCTRNYNGVYPYTFFGYSYPVQGTLDDIMAINFGGGAAGGAGANAFASSGVRSLNEIEDVEPQKQGRAKNQYIEYGNVHVVRKRETAATEELQQSGSTTPAPTHPPKKYRKVIIALKSRQLDLFEDKENKNDVEVVQEQDDEVKADQVVKTDTPTAISPEVMRAEESGSVAGGDGACKAIGVKCFRNEECCTKLCHGFLHQCVT